MDLPPPFPIRRTNLRPRMAARVPLIERASPPPIPTQGNQKSSGIKRAQWTAYDLKMTIYALDHDYIIGEVSQAFNIPRTSLRDHYEGKVKGRKMGPKATLIMEEKEKLVEYMEEMVKLAHPLSPNDLKLKVAEICQSREISFKDGIPRRSWLKWFKKRHPHLVMRIPQGLDMKRAKNLCPSQVQAFYENLQTLYNQEEYPPSHIWNVDENGANASRNGFGKVFAPRGTRSVHLFTPNDQREWISVLTCINASGEIIPNYYIFKGLRIRRDYIALCEDGATFDMQKKGWVDSYQFSTWMDNFVMVLRGKRTLSTTSRHLLILDGHKAHLTLEILTKAKRNGIDMVSLPSHTSHRLQPLDVSCFKPFKVAFRAYKNMWSVNNHGAKVRKEDLANWMPLALKKALTTSNIKAGFRGSGIWPLNFQAMQSKMGPSRGFVPITPADVAQEDEDIAEMMEEGLPSPSSNPIHFYMDNENVDDLQEEELSSQDPPPTQPNISTFLRLPQQDVPTHRSTLEPLVDYSQSQILTSNDHVSTLESIAQKKKNLQGKGKGKG